MTAARGSWTADDRYGVASTISLRASLRVGALRVDVLSDGSSADKDPRRALGAPSDAAWMEALGVTDPNARRLGNAGCFLIRGDGRTVLIDTGYGGLIPAPATGVGWGELRLRLREVGVRPEDVDLVVHTHLHGDHIAGDIIVPEGVRAFPNARVLAPQGDLDHWLDADTDPGGSPFAKPVMSLLREQGVLDAFSGERVVTPSLTMFPTPGHTPGHHSALVASNGEHLVIIGDVAIHPVQFEHLDWVKKKDTDRAASSRSRAEVAALAADKNALVTGGHFPILTIGRIRRTWNGFRWEAEAAPPLFEEPRPATPVTRRAVGDALTLEERVTRLEAVQEVSNLMGRYAFHREAGRNEAILALFAQKTMGAAAEIVSHGQWRGRSSLKQLWLDFMRRRRHPSDHGAGRLDVQNMTTPVIEVARDGRTAKGVWMVPGMISERDDTGTLRAWWTFGKYEVEFVREEGGWKIWHLHAYAVVRSPYEKSWVEAAAEGSAWYPPMGAWLPGDATGADAPATYHRMYDPETRLEGVPEPPRPYDSYQPG